MQLKNRLLIVILSCAVAGVSGVAIAALLFRPKQPADVSLLPHPDGMQPAAPNTLPSLFPTPEFSLVDQSGKTVTHEAFRGRPWIVDFVFTNCAGPCPVMTARMSQLQKQLAGDNVKLVTFSVDPQHDRPEVLTEYAKKFDADPARWSFLTTSDGSTQPIYDVAAGMKLTALGATKDSPILHSEKFLLVDGKGEVRGIYSSSDSDSMNKLVADAGKLAKGDAS